MSFQITLGVSSCLTQRHVGCLVVELQEAGFCDIVFKPHNRVVLCFLKNVSTGSFFLLKTMIRFACEVFKSLKSKVVPWITKLFKSCFLKCIKPSHSLFWRSYRHGECRNLLPVCRFYYIEDPVIFKEFFGYFTHFAFDTICLLY